MTKLEKEILITKDQAGINLTENEQIKLHSYPNEENDLRIQIIKAKYSIKRRLNELSI